MSKVVPLKIQKLSLSPNDTSIINEDISSVERKNCNVNDSVHAMPQQNYNNENNKRLPEQGKENQCLTRYLKAYQITLNIYMNGEEENVKI